MADQCIQGCRERFIRYYQFKSSESISRPAAVPLTSSIHPLKRKIAEMIDDDDEDSEDDDYYVRAQRHIASQQAEQNQFDHYYNSIIVMNENETASSWWRWNEPNYRELALMFRDIGAVPPTGAGVEREFSKSGRVATWTRSRLNAGTISEIMLFKNFLARKGDAISEWDDAGVPELGIATEIVEPGDVPKKWRKRWWNDSKARWARN